MGPAPPKTSAAVACSTVEEKSLVWRKKGAADEEEGTKALEEPTQQEITSKETFIVYGIQRFLGLFWVVKMVPMKCFVEWLEETRRCHRRRVDENE